MIGASMWYGPEASLRRPTWTEGKTFDGGDGQAWYLPTLDSAAVLRMPAVFDALRAMGRPDFHWRGHADLPVVLEACVEALTANYDIDRLKAQILIVGPDDGTGRIELARLGAWEAMAEALKEEANSLPSPPSPDECRRDDWVEGLWVTLGDGRRWCFPPASAVPDHAEMARRAAAKVVDGMVAMLNADGIMRQGQALAAGEPAGLWGSFATIQRALGVYQATFRMASDMLSRNYDLSESDCQALMPFDYQFSELADPASKIHTARPETLLMCNVITLALGVDIGAELERIGSSN